jgi:hypothetical protein
MPKEGITAKGAKFIAKDAKVEEGSRAASGLQTGFKLLCNSSDIFLDGAGRQVYKEARP